MCPQYSVIGFILFLPIFSLSINPVFFELFSSFIIHYFFHELFKVILVGSKLLMKVKKKSEKADLKLSIHKTKMMASDPITSLAIRGENNRNSDRLFSWAPKSLHMVTIAMKLKDACSLEEKL